ncbi:hypothetical protein VPNG_06444 [Cytospora leucostoma]|uniref:Rhodopsin domain-containing protein n=1 Tax=Cytospora leucostoma TaxID=1230097 RepID=A0A423WYP5_9PEZI|nr:hypothetical protein VPNG_06444 [Cytospora leucostoma]
MSASEPAGLDLCMIPGASPPHGTVVNFENPVTLVPVIVSVCVIMTAGAILLTACRLYVSFKRREWWWSDCFVTIALMFSMVQTGLFLSQAKFARHQWDTRACWYDDKYAKILFLQSILTTFALFFSKASILLLFNQLFGVKRPVCLAVRFGIIFAGVLYFTGIPITAYMSTPHGGDTWASGLNSERSQKELIWGIVVAAVGTLLDIFIFVLPLPVILRLQMTTRRKVSTAAVFGTALLGVIASILSLIYRIETLGAKDSTWTFTALMTCIVVENDVAIIVSSTHGFSRFIKMVSELRIVRSLRSRLGGSRSVKSEKPQASWQKEDPNRPRTGRGSGKKTDHGLYGLSETAILRSTSSAEVDEGMYDVSQARICPGILRTVDVTQETHYPGTDSATMLQGPHIRYSSSGAFYYGPRYESEAYASTDHPFQNSPDDHVVNGPGEPCKFCKKLIPLRFAQGSRQTEDIQDS